ncbi:MAG: hypothetical protein KF744_06480 [Taibaiella sp.]|nr:hypothetical protein [Taibaiella sp.]
MKPGTEAQMKDELEKAHAVDVWPGYNNEDEWMQLSKRLPRKRSIPLRAWVAAAGIAAIGFATYWLTIDRTQTEQRITSSKPAWLEMPANAVPEATQIAKQTETEVAAKNPKHRQTGPVAKEIYNGTPCPIAVRINQVKSCPNVKPEPISSSSTLQPAGTAQITYEDHQTVAAECSVAVKEIEIKSIATGDVILLNANSTPATVQEAFRIMTRESEGKILAGAFDHDCRKRERKLSLELDNSRGRITLE